MPSVQVLVAILRVEPTLGDDVVAWIDTATEEQRIALRQVLYGINNALWQLQDASYRIERALDGLAFGRQV